MEITIANLSSTCRTCLGVSHELTSIFSADTQLVAEIEYCAGFAVRAGDGLPTNICGNCQRDLVIAAQFIRKCRNSNEQLHTILDKLEIPSFDENFKQEYKVDNDLQPVDALWDEQDSQENCTVIKNETENATGIDAAFRQNFNVDLISEHNHVLKKKRGKERKNKKVCAQSRKDANNRHVCSTCGVTSQSRAALNIHLRTHTGERPFVCHHCGGRYAQKSTLQVHIARRHSQVKIVREKKFKCDTCEKCYATSTNLKIHIRSHTGETPFACTMCSARFTQVGPLLAHRRRHLGEKPHKCETCGRRFGERTHLLRHRSVHTDERPFECGICGVRLKSNYALKMHIERHSGNKPHVCDKCGMAFKSNGSLSSHTRNVHSEKSGLCTICKKPVSDLAEHSLLHSGEKRHACLMCDARFSGRRGLAVHLRQHSIPDYPCSVDGCSQVFRRSWQLDTHLLKHSIRQHVCKICRQAFTHAGQLTRHLNQHHIGNEKALLSEGHGKID